MSIFAEQTDELTSLPTFIYIIVRLFRGMDFIQERYIFINKGKLFVGMFVTSSILKGLSDRKTDIILRICRHRGRFLGFLEFCQAVVFF